MTEPFPDSLPEAILASAGKAFEDMYEGEAAVWWLLSLVEEGLIVYKESK